MPGNTRPSFRQHSALAVLLLTGLGAGTGPDNCPAGRACSGQDPVFAPYAESIPGTLITLRMMPIPGGSVQIRTADGVRRVEVAPFWIGETEITWDAYDVWVFELDRHVERGEDATARPSRPYVLPGDEFGHQGHPALGMTYTAAEQFARWLSARTGREYRVPTEAEWELACRADVGPEPPPDLSRVAWFRENAGRRTRSVGQKPAGSAGLRDVLGNAAEWVTGDQGRPLLKGGSFDDPADAVSCTAGRAQTPAWNARDPQLPKSRWWLSDAPFVGLRLVRGR